MFQNTGLSHQMPHSAAQAYRRCADFANYVQSRHKAAYRRLARPDLRVRMVYDQDRELKR